MYIASVVTLVMQPIIPLPQFSHVTQSARAVVAVIAAKKNVASTRMSMAQSFYT
jgi:hypothetical protein